jgi:hypothetical protein
MKRRDAVIVPVFPAMVVVILCDWPCILAAPAANKVSPKFQENMVATPDVTTLQRSDLNQFLFADIGTEANGMALSVLSVFARRGSDPWTEAGRLAGLPKAEATDSLARMIATMPNSLWALPDAVVIAVRLIGMLPARPAAGIRQVARRWPANQIALAAACIALIIAFIVMIAQR